MAHVRHGDCGLARLPCPIVHPARRLTLYGSKLIRNPQPVDFATLSSVRIEGRPRRLNLVERLFALLTEKQLRRGVHRSTRELEAAIRTYLEHHNRHPRPFIWTKTADQILDAVAKFCKRISTSGHY